MNLPDINDCDSAQSSSHEQPRLTRKRRQQEQQQEDDTDNDVDPDLQPTKKRSQNLLYFPVASAQTLELGVKTLQEGILGFKYGKDSENKKDGLTVRNFYCTEIGRRKCPVRIQLVPVSNHHSRMIINISNNEHEHNHENKRGICQTIKDEIIYIYNELYITKPTLVQFKLNDRNVNPLPSVEQIRTFLKTVKADSIQQIDKLNKLYAWCQDNVAVPHENDKMYCPAVEIERSGKKIKTIRLFLTTVQLLSLADQKSKF
jgi:hypothetical protein